VPQRLRITHERGRLGRPGCPHPARRPFILSRAGWAGLQRHVWTGLPTSRPAGRGWASRSPPPSDSASRECPIRGLTSEASAGPDTRALCALARVVGIDAVLPDPLRVGFASPRALAFPRAHRGRSTGSSASATGFFPISTCWPTKRPNTARPWFVPSVGPSRAPTVRP